MIATTTLKKIREHLLCADNWTKLLEHLGKKKADNDALSLRTVLDNNGLVDAIWCLRACDAPDFEIRKFARLCALDVAHLWNMPTAVREYLETGDESKQDAAWRAANADARGAASAASAAEAAALTARAAAARAAASADAARDAAFYAASAAAWSDASAAAAWRAAWDDASAAVSAAAAWDAVRQKQTDRFVEMFCTENT